jgi:hypothetical protein
MDRLGDLDTDLPRPFCLPPRPRSPGTYVSMSLRGGGPLYGDCLRYGGDLESRWGLESYPLES